MRRMPCSNLLLTVYIAVACRLNTELLSQLSATLHVCSLTLAFLMISIEIFDELSSL